MQSCIELFQVHGHCVAVLCLAFASPHTERIPKRIARASEAQKGQNYTVVQRGSWRPLRFRICEANSSLSTWSGKSMYLGPQLISHPGCLVICWRLPRGFRSKKWLRSLWLQIIIAQNLLLCTRNIRNAPQKPSLHLPWENRTHIQCLHFAA